MWVDIGAEKQGGQHEEAQHEQKEREQERQLKNRSDRVEGAAPTRKREPPLKKQGTERKWLQEEGDSGNRGYRRMLSLVLTDGRSFLRRRRAAIGRVLSGLLAEETLLR